jgi:hypothetical protein
MKVANRKTLVLVALASFAGACETQGTDVDDSGGAPEAGAGLVASLKLAGGTTVEFVEPLPGLTAVIELGSYPQRPALNDRLSALEPLALYRALAPGQSPPASLKAASERGRLAAHTKPGATDLAFTPVERDDPGSLYVSSIAPAPAGGQIAQVDDDGLCPGEPFEMSYDGCGWAFLAEWHHCTLWQHANTSFQFGNLDFSHAGACSYRGVVRHMVRYKTFFSWSLPITHVLNPGDWLSVFKGRATFDHTIRTEVVDAEPEDGYHHGGWGSID